MMPGKQLANEVRMARVLVRLTENMIYALLILA